MSLLSSLGAAGISGAVVAYVAKFPLGLRIAVAIGAFLLVLSACMVAWGWWKARTAPGDRKRGSGMPDKQEPKVTQNVTGNTVGRDLTVVGSVTITTPSPESEGRRSTATTSSTSPALPRRQRAPQRARRPRGARLPH